MFLPLGTVLPAILSALDTRYFVYWSVPVT